MRRSAPLALLVCAFALGVSVVPATAQRAAPPTPRTLDQVESLVESGRTEDARSALLEWWSASRSSASAQDLQRGLWLRARLTVDPSQAALDYRRLVVEYPGGRYSAEALFRLAQASWASGDSTEAAREVGRLDREYPGSRVRDEARAWLAAAGSPPPPPAARSGAADVSARSSSAAVSTATTDRYAVQLGAFSTEARATTVQAKAQGAGFEARLVRIPGSRLVRVRVGRYGSESEAGEMKTKLVRLGFPAAIVTDANREELIRK